MNSRIEAAGTCALTNTASELVAISPIGAKLATGSKASERASAGLVPNDVAVRVAQTDGYLYAVADDRVLLVAPVNRVVVGVFMDDVQTPKPEGTRRTP